MGPGLADKSRPLVVGANHRSSSMMLRDRLFVEEAAVPGFLKRLGENGIAQALVLSTCDRVEVLAVTDDRDDGVRRIVEVLAAHAEVRPAEIVSQLYTLWDLEAVRHVFSVTASLDSLMIGEPQVLGQVKDSHRAAIEAGLSGSELEALLQAAYSAAKKVRTGTGIGQRPVSMAAAAVELARDLHGDLDRCRAILVGGGDMGELVAKDLLGEGLTHLTITHPVEGRAEALARALRCHFAPFEQLEELMVDADVVLTSLGTRRRAITAEMVKAILKRRRQRPVFFVDTGIPGDVEPAVNDVDGAFLYDLNDLERVAMEGRATREAEAGNAWKIVDAEVAFFLQGQAERAAVPAVSSLRRHFETIRLQALADAAGDAEKATRLLVNRLLHGPSEAMRRAAAAGEDFQAAETLLRRLFPMDDEETRP